MKKIHDILKARKKHLHETHSKKPLHTDFHAPIFKQPWLSKQDVKLSALAAAMSARSIFKASKSSEPVKSKEEKEKVLRPLPEKKPSTQANLPSLRFFRPKRSDGADQPAKSKKSTEEGEGGLGGDRLDKERIARLRTLLANIIDHPATMTPHMFWILFMQIAPHFSLSTAGCVRVSALFWMTLSYIKAKNKNKKRKLKQQLTEASELLEKDSSVMMVKRR